MNAPLILQPQAEYLESSFATALVAMAHFDSLASASQLSFKQQQQVHSIMYQMNELADDLTQLTFLG